MISRTEQARMRDELHKTDKFYARIVVVLAAVLVLLLGALGVPSYVQFKEYTENNSYTENQKKLRQVELYMETLHKSAVQTVFDQFENGDNNVLLTDAAPDPSETSRARRELERIARSNAAYLSLILYSGASDRFYASKGNPNGDPYLRKTIDQFHAYQMLTPYPHTLPEMFYIPYAEKLVITYFYYQTIGETIRSAAFAYVDASTLCDMMRTMWGDEGNAYIMFPSQEQYVDRAGMLHDWDDMGGAAEKMIDKQTGTFQWANAAGDNAVYTYRRCGFSDWVLVIEEPDTKLVESARTIRTLIIEISAVAAVGTIVLGILLARKIYAPFANLIDRVAKKRKESGQKNGIFRDEIQMLGESFDEMNRIIDKYQAYKASTQSILTDHYVSAVLQHNLQSLEPLRALTPDVQAFFRAEGRLIVVRLPIDASDALSAEIARISQAVRAVPADPLYVVRMREPYVAVLLPADVAAGEAVRVVQDALEEIEYARHIVYISAPLCGEAAYSDAFRGALRCLSYPTIYRRGQVLTENDIRTDAATAPEMAAKPVLTKIRNAAPDAPERFRALVMAYAQAAPEWYLKSLTEWLPEIARAADGSEISPVETYRLLASFTSMDDLFDWFDAIFAKLCRRAADNDKYTALVASVRAYLEAHFGEPLTMRTVAEQFRISPSYLSTIFHDCTGLTMVDYLRKLRMDEARRLLADTKLSVTDVMQRIGLTNESNFYKQFKSDFGVTPNTYRTQLRLHSEETAECKNLSLQIDSNRPHNVGQR